MTSRRKHITQMTNREVDAFTRLLRSVSSWRGLDNPHLTERKQKWSVRDGEVLEAIRHGELIEVHNNEPGDPRAVVRQDIGYRSLCVTVSLINKGVVTVWVNTQNDHHATLNAREYQWNINLLSLVPSIEARLR